MSFFLAANKKKGQAGKTKGKKGKRLRNEFKMDIKDMIVKKRLASLNASAIMSASYAQERPFGKVMAGGPAGGSGEISATAMVPYSAAQAAMALKKAKKESLAEAVKLAATTAAAAAAKLASSKTQIKGKCFCKVDVEGSSQIILSTPNSDRTY